MIHAWALLRSVAGLGFVGNCASPLSLSPANPFSPAAQHLSCWHLLQRCSLLRTAAGIACFGVCHLYIFGRNMSCLYVCRLLSPHFFSWSLPPFFHSTLPHFYHSAVVKMATLPPCTLLQSVSPPKMYRGLTWSVAHVAPQANLQDLEPPHAPVVGLEILAADRDRNQGSTRSHRQACSTMGTS